MPRRRRRPPFTNPLATTTDRCFRLPQLRESRQPFLLLFLFFHGAQAGAMEPFATDTVVVIANRLPQPQNAVNAAVSVVDAATLERTGTSSVAEAAARVPNAGLVEFTARAVSNAQFRGVGGSPANPGVTTTLDGVPQLSGDTSSQELLDVGQIEFVRGAQGTLYGRNTLGGVINQLSVVPDGSWASDVELRGGDFDRREVRGALAGPLFGDDRAFRLAAGQARRDGYTRNDFTGHDLDDRCVGHGAPGRVRKPVACRPHRIRADCALHRESAQTLVRRPLRQIIGAASWEYERQPRMRRSARPHQRRGQ